MVNQVEDVSHRWGDTDVDWGGVDKAARYIGTRLRRYRIGVAQYKEKWGQVRVYCSLGWNQVHDITHPGHAFSRYPKWLWKLDCGLGRLIVWPMNWLVVPFHQWIYRQTYAKAVQKWPHLRDEILCAADYDELLKGL